MKNLSKDKGCSRSKSSNGFVPSSFKFISSCIKTASSGVRSAGASVAASISGDGNDRKDQVAFCVSAILQLLPSEIAICVNADKKMTSQTCVSFDR